jgi:glucose-6-phosphate-specific signal transduction histidine kinase
MNRWVILLSVWLNLTAAMVCLWIIIHIGENFPVAVLMAGCIALNLVSILSLLRSL